MCRNLCFVALMLLTPAFAFTQVLNSGGLPVSLVELYTSEGCSSCPPADRFMSSLRDHPQLFRQFVPMAFHVDYWNYLGWADRFSDAAFSDRQRKLATYGSAARVYTPGMFINGREWRGILHGGQGFDGVIRRPRKPAGNLRVAVLADRLVVNFSGKKYSEMLVHWAWLGSGLTTAVSAGENHGRELRHDFVVLDWQQRKVSGFPAELTYVAAPEAGQARTALAVWITLPDSPAAIQAVADWVDP